MNDPHPKQFKKTLFFSYEEIKMPIEEEYKGRGGSGGKSTGGGRSYGGGGNNNSSSTPKIKTKYDLSSEEVKKLSPEEKAKYDEYHRYDTHSLGMFWLAFLLMCLAIIITVLVYYYYIDGVLIKNKYFKYDSYVIMGSIFGSLATASIFSGIESTKARDHMKKLLADGQAEQKAKNDKTKAEQIAEHEKIMAAKMLAKNDMPPPPAVAK